MYSVKALNVKETRKVNKAALWPIPQWSKTISHIPYTKAFNPWDKSSYAKEAKGNSLINKSINKKSGISTLTTGDKIDILKSNHQQLDSCIILWITHGILFDDIEPEI